MKVLRNEMRLGHVARNVGEVAEFPAVEIEDAPRRALTIDELRALLAGAEGSRLVLVELCGRNGLRPAEARALRWQDLDLDRQELSVTGQNNRRNERSEVKRAHNAARTILIDSTSVDRLQRWHRRQCDLQSSAGPAWQDLDIVASTSQGTAIGRHAFARSMKLLCRRVGIDPHITPYELRHTAISHQADAGRTSWEIADWAGTSEAMISSRYRHRLRRVAGIRPVELPEAD